MLNLNFDPFPELFTPRLILRKIGKDDDREIFFFRTDHRVMKYLDRAPAKSLEEAQGYIQKIQDMEKNNDSITWAISLKGDPKLIGTLGFWNITKEHFRAEIGYALHPDHQGKGLMQEAFKPVLDYGFKIMKLHSVEANVNPNNAASIKLLERNKFIKEAYFRENYYFNGMFLDSVIYSLLTTGH